MNTIAFFVQQMMLFCIPLLVVALGGLFSERSGIVNVGLEGIMIIGAFCSIFFISKMQQSIQGQIILLPAILIAATAGILIALPHAFASINMNANQVISGTAINVFAPAFSIYIARTVQASTTQQVPFVNNFRIAKVPFLGDIPIIGQLFFQNIFITSFLGIAILVMSWFFLYKTKFGLRLRACGEYPQAADSAGINVARIRYAATLISGALGGIGGLIFILSTTTAFNATVAGYGFLALAVLIFGQRKPWRVAAGALFFGIMKTLASVYSSIPFFNKLEIPSDFYKMLPYAATLIVLACTSRNNKAPQALGKPYEKSTR